VAAVPVILKERRVRPLAALIISPLGFFGWSFYSWVMVGTPLAFLKAEKIWGSSHFVWFLAPFLDLLHLFTGLHALKNGAVVLSAATLIVLFVGVVLLARARDVGVFIPLFWWVFTIGSVLATLSPFFPDSVLRYSMAVIPLFGAFAWKMRPAWEGPVVGMLACSQGVLALIVLQGALNMHHAHFFP
jgi:hypothetical protein